MEHVRCPSCDSDFSTAFDHCPNCGTPSLWRQPLLPEQTSPSTKPEAEVPATMPPAQSDADSLEGVARLMGLVLWAGVCALPGFVLCWIAQVVGTNWEPSFGGAMGAALVGATFGLFTGLLTTSIWMVVLGKICLNLIEAFSGGYRHPGSSLPAGPEFESLSEGFRFTCQLSSRAAWVGGILGTVAGGSGAYFSSLQGGTLGGNLFLLFLGFCGALLERGKVVRGLWAPSPVPAVSGRSSFAWLTRTLGPFLVAALLSGGILYWRFDGDNLTRGIDALQTRDYDRAIVRFNAALQSDPKSFHLYIYRGITYHRMYEFRQAQQDFQTAIDMAPDNSQGYAGRGGTYLSRGEYALAKKDAEKAIRIAPKDPDAHALLATVCLRQAD